MCTCMTAPIQFKIGDGQPNTPINNTDSFTDARLKDGRFTYEKFGVGTMGLGVHYSLDYKGTVTFLNGQKFSTDEFYTIKFY